MNRTTLKIVLTIGLAAMLFISVQAQTSESLMQKTAQAEVLNNQAADLIDAGKFAEAIQLLREAIALRSDYTIAYGNLGTAFYGEGRMPEAAVALKKAIALKSNFAEDYNKLGAIYARTGKSNEAVALFERANELQPDFAPAYYNLGCLYTQLKKFKKAKNPIEQFVRLQPQNAEARFLLGRLYLLENDKPAAQVQYKSLAALDSPLAQKLYAAIYADLLVSAAGK